MKVSNLTFIFIVLLLALQDLKLFAQKIVVVGHQPRVVVIPETELIVIPGTYIYYLRAEEDDIFFFRGYWWWCKENRWYRAPSYSGPWAVISIHYVPVELTRLPPGWREIKNEHPRVRWIEVRDRWQEWEREKYWEKSGWRRTPSFGNPIERREEKIRRSRRR